MSIDKTALIIEGGGTRGVFSFGVIDTFIKEQFDPFKIYIGVSNGAAALNWYLIKEKDYNLEKMLYSANKKYINYFEDWINRPEYSRWINRALKKEGPGYQNLGPLK